MVPKQIKLADSEHLAISWNDGHLSSISLKSLRDNCPCATCQGETVLLKQYLPVIQPEMPGKYQLVSAHSVGSYAIGMAWGDGHQTGIYPFALLRSLCECSVCVSERERLPDAG